jgi:hypothetical protein
VQMKQPILFVERYSREVEKAPRIRGSGALCFCPAESKVPPAFGGEKELRLSQPVLETMLKLEIIANLLQSNQ